MSSKYVELLACPDCRRAIQEIKGNEQVHGFFCESCEWVYPMIEEIPILLPKSARSYDLEYALVKDIAQHLPSPPMKALAKSIDNTLQLIASFKGRKSWEWEDEEFWSKAYKKESGAADQKHWGLRIWQREWLINQLTKRMSLRGKTILDVGCGEGQNFRILLSQHCDDDSLYIATDISIEGLKLNRSRNKHRNSIYVLCSADKLPFREKTIDLLCYFGILHHTERKSGTIAQDGEIVAKDGYIIIHEALDRPFVSSILPFLRKSVEESAHEERVNKKDLISIITTTKGFEVVCSRETHTILFGFARRFLKVNCLNKKWFYQILFYSDILFLKIFGRMSPALSSGEIMLLLRNS